MNKLSLILLLIMFTLTSIVFAEKNTSTGGEDSGGGGSTLYNRVDKVCTRHCYKSIWAVGIPLGWTYQIIQVEGTEVHCFKGGNELCNPVACTASCN